MDYITTKYLDKAFPDAEIDVSTYSTGQTYDVNRIEISILYKDRRVTRNFNRTLLLTAVTDESVQKLIVGIFKARFDG